MDNDFYLKKYAAKIYKKIKFNLDYRFKDIKTKSECNEKIASLIHSNKPFMYVRLGAVESRCVDKLMKKKNFTPQNVDSIKYAAGVFPNDNDSIKRFCEIYTKSLENTDILGIWGVKGEKRILNKYCPDATLTHASYIEPYYHDIPWSRELKNKRVLVIHPFTSSIKKQYEKRELIFENKNILPEFKELILIKAIQSNAGGDINNKFESWFEALEYMKEEINRYDFDIAIIGAGAYGLPLAHYIKSIGKQAIQLSGSTQILFGIKGKRWDKNSKVSKLYNKHWIRPTLEETPPNIEKVEGGSYW